MMNYSTSLEERKDFILGYKITKDGKIIVKFAKGEPFPLPYNKENELIILNKMKVQLEDASEKKQKLNDKIYSFKISLGVTAAALIFFVGLALGFSSLIPKVLMVILNVVNLGIGTAALVSLINLVYSKIVLSDLDKNMRFIEIEPKLNANARSNNNVLLNVSNRTKRYIRNLPEDREVFNINSFNYVPFSDLEEIIENVERNERFGFVYDEPQQEAKSKTRKKKR